MADKELVISQERESASLPGSDKAVTVSDADNLLKPGELSYAEVTAGGLGRHLGLFSTTFLMYVNLMVRQSSLVSHLQNA